LALGLAAAAAWGAASPATAQQMQTVEELRTCLCLEYQLDQLRDEIAARKQEYDAQQAEVAKIQARAIEGYERVDVDDPNSVEAYKTLVVQRRAAEQHLQREVAPAYNAAVKAYDDLQAQHTQQCANRSYRQEDLAVAAQGLNCEAQQ
jgi:hypothetical protein